MSKKSILAVVLAVVAVGAFLLVERFHLEALRLHGEGLSSGAMKAAVTPTVAPPQMVGASGWLGTEEMPWKIVKVGDCEYIMYKSGDCGYGPLYQLVHKGDCPNHPGHEAANWSRQ
jgi:hypothetical protein